jgi:hypothetical protein
MTSIRKIESNKRIGEHRAFSMLAYVWRGTRDAETGTAVNLAQQILRLHESKSDRSPPAPRALPLASQVKVEASPPRPDVPGGRETKTAAELAQMIEADLAKHPECPKKGFQVTVYGTTLWRAMLTITPAAGPVRNPQEWRDLTEELAERLPKRYDLAWR